MNPTEIFKKFKIALIYCIVAFNFVGFIHTNVVLEYFIDKHRFYNFDGDNIKKYRAIMDPYIDISNILGLNTVCKMYVSRRRITLWIEWYLQDEAGLWHHYETNNHSPEQRRLRSFWDAWFFDSKVAIMQLSFAAIESPLKKKFSRYLCQSVEENLGWSPQTVRAIGIYHPKLTPDEKKLRKFDLMTAPHSGWKE